MKHNFQRWMTIGVIVGIGSVAAAACGGDDKASNTDGDMDASASGNNTGTTNGDTNNTNDTTNTGDTNNTGTMDASMMMMQGMDASMMQGMDASMQAMDGGANTTGNQNPSDAGELGSDVTEVLSCEGNCSCDTQTSSCDCTGDTVCVANCVDGCDLDCSGTSDCVMQCNEGCNATCPGTSDCQVRLGDNSTGSCDGTGDCDFICEGDCTISCLGASVCTIQCLDPNATCEFDNSCMNNNMMDCGDGVKVCRTSCTPDGGLGLPIPGRDGGPPIPVRADGGIGRP